MALRCVRWKTADACQGVQYRDLLVERGVPGVVPTWRLVGGGVCLAYEDVSPLKQGVGDVMYGSAPVQSVDDHRQGLGVSPIRPQTVPVLEGG